MEQAGAASAPGAESTKPLATSGQPLLSICIPTFNRAVYLREALESLSIALQGNEAGFEIVVSDNASTDDTSSVLKAFQERHPLTRLYRNSENIGGEQNFYRVVELARGKYVWMFGDDDKISKDLLSVLRGRLKGNPDVVICNYSVNARDFSFAYKKAFFSPTLQESYTDRNAVLAGFGPGVGYISSVVFRRELYFTVSRERYNQYIPFGFSFLYAVYGGLPRKVRVEFIREPLVLYRGNNPGGLDWERCFIDGLVLVFDELGEMGYSSRSVRQAKDHAIHQFVRPYTVGKRIAGGFTSTLFTRIFRAYRNCFRFWIEIVPVFLIPKNVLFWLKRVLKRPSG